LKCSSSFFALCFFLGNGSAEDQAVDRIHRLGQKHEVNVIRFICKDTIEEQILLLQQKKRQITSHALNRYEKSKLSQHQERLQDIIMLFK